jgi:hypothetical protein
MARQSRLRLSSCVVTWCVRLKVADGSSTCPRWRDLQFGEHCLAAFVDGLLYVHRNTGLVHAFEGQADLGGAGPCTAVRAAAVLIMAKLADIGSDTPCPVRVLP